MPEKGEEGIPAGVWYSQVDRGRGEIRAIGEGYSLREREDIDDEGENKGTDDQRSVEQELGRGCAFSRGCRGCHTGRSYSVLPPLAWPRTLLYNRRSGMAKDFPAPPSR